MVSEFSEFKSESGLTLPRTSDHLTIDTPMVLLGGLTLNLTICFQRAIDPNSVNGTD